MVVREIDGDGVFRCSGVILEEFGLRSFVCRHQRVDLRGERPEALGLLKVLVNRVISLQLLFMLLRGNGDLDAD